MELTLSNGTTITLNDQQAAAVEVMQKWALDRQFRFCYLAGYAGSGKTTIVRYLLQSSSRIMLGSICVSAPTHKAKAKIYQSTGEEAETLQGLLGLAPDVSLEDFDPNKPEFRQLREPKMGKYNTLLIDESSMVSTYLFELVNEVADSCGTRVLYILDPAQLPPVKEDISPVIASDAIPPQYRIMLTKVERQAEDNPLMPIYDELRSTLPTASTALYRKGSQINEKGEGINLFRGDNRAFARHAISLFKEDLTGPDPGRCKLLCYTNDTVHAWNSMLRMVLIGTKEPPLLVEGEILMSYSNVKGKITNSAEYRVLSKQQVQRDYTKPLAVNGKEQTLKVEPITVWETRLVDIDTGLEVTIDIIPNESGMILARAAMQFKTYCKADRSRWTAYYDWRARFYLMKDVKSSLGKTMLTKDLDYGYAMTIHKSQGSTYKHVFVDEKDINTNKKVVERNKLRYVALSRPTHTASVLI